MGQPDAQDRAAEMNDTAGSAARDHAVPASAEPATAPPKAKLRPLRLLVPYVMRYRARAGHAGMG